MQEFFFLTGQCFFLLERLGRKVFLKSSPLKSQMVRSLFETGRLFVFRETMECSKRTAITETATVTNIRSMFTS